MAEKTTGKELNKEAVPQDLRELQKDTDNIYKSLVIIGKRAKEIALQEKMELQSKLEEFAPASDNLEEVFENREQIEISMYYERKPKPTIAAIQEFKDGEIEYGYRKEDDIESMIEGDKG